MKHHRFIEQHDARHCGLSPKQVSPHALKVMARLRDCTQQAYAVGGCVRDLLLQRQPKDFDLATDLHPWQIKKLFNNCRLIGHRFCLAHIYFGRDIIEVATFRAMPKPGRHKPSVKRSGMLRRDNNYGSLQEDIVRRDFTVNALYYDPFEHKLLAYKNAMQDLHNKRLCIIGNSQVRYREDPVRMLRAVRFASSRALRMHDDVARPLPQLAYLLHQVAPARLLHEFVKLFHGGYAVAVFYALCRHRLFKTLFPLTDRNLHDHHRDPHQRFLDCLLSDTDQRIAYGDVVPPAFTMAGFLWWPSLSYCKQRGWNQHADGLHRAIDHVIKRQARHIALPRSLADAVRDILVAQNQFKHHRRRAHQCLSSAACYRAALHFAHLRTMAEREHETMQQSVRSLR